ncbi:MAG: hypothetical protein R3B48_05315 [Kofleriaceae bacterium]
MKLPRVRAGRSLALGAALCALAACDTHARGSYFEDQIRPGLTERVGELRRLTCPERVRIENQTTEFRCEVELAASEGVHTILVTLERDGSLHWAGE